MFSQALHNAILFWLLSCVFCNRFSKLHLGPAQFEDKAHLKQHIGNKTDIDNMSIHEIRFQYFKSHDFNRDYKLDGQEIIKAIFHYLVEYGSVSKYVFSDQDLASFLDQILERNDRNDDGFIDYLEFMSFNSVD